MPKKITPSYTGGAADRKRRGLRSLTVPIDPALLEACRLAAAAAGMPMTRWAAAALEDAAKKNQEKS